MRLIDADRIEKVYVSDPIFVDGGYRNHGYYTYEIASQPTVEALPVEWLKEQYDKAIEEKDDTLAANIDQLIKLWNKDKKFYISW